MAEMIHLQKLGELIYLLGGSINYTAKYRDGRQVVWTPQHLKLQENAREMLIAGIESEKYHVAASIEGRIIVREMGWNHA